MTWEVVVPYLVVGALCGAAGLLVGLRATAKDMEQMQDTVIRLVGLWRTAEGRADAAEAELAEARETQKRLDAMFPGRGRDDGV